MTTSSIGLIYAFIDEISKCDYHALTQEQEIPDLTYNGISYCEGSVVCQRLLKRGYRDFQTCIIEHKDRIDIQVLYRDLDKVKNQYWDIPSEEALKAYQDEKPDHGVSRSVQEILFLREMYGVQLSFIQMAMDWLKDLDPSLKSLEVKEVTAVEERRESRRDTKQTPEISEEERLYIDELRTLKKEIYNSKETALILDITDDTLRKMRNNNEIGYSSKNGSPKVWFTRQNILDYLNEPEVKHKSCFL